MNIEKGKKSNICWREEEKEEVQKQAWLIRKQPSEAMLVAQ